MSNMDRNTCPVCGTKFHYCGSCGYNIDTHPRQQGYCSLDCLRAAGGPEYVDDDDIPDPDESR